MIIIIIITFYTVMKLSLDSFQKTQNRPTRVLLFAKRSFCSNYPMTRVQLRLIYDGTRRGGSIVLRMCDRS